MHTTNNKKIIKQTIETNRVRKRVSKGGKTENRERDTNRNKKTTKSESRVERNTYIYIYICKYI